MSVQSPGTILAAGLTPAWQQILVFDRVETGEVNRAKVTMRCASGKVLNVARAAHTLGGRVVTLSTAGGPVGNSLRHDLSSGAEGSITARWVETLSETRTCTTLVDESTGTVTELVENSAPVSAAERACFAEQFQSLLADARCVVLSGSLPPETPVGFYAELIRTCQVPVILDARGPELLQTLQYRPRLVKPNWKELEQTVGQPLNTETDLQAAMRTLNDQGAEWVLVTRGGDAAWLSSRTELFRFDSHRLERVVNPIGCGDSVAAGIAVRLMEGAEMPEAVEFGLAAGTENATSLVPALLDRSRVEERLGLHPGRPFGGSICGKTGPSDNCPQE